MLKEELLRYNQEGFIPGPNEEKKEYLERIEYGISLRNRILETDFHSVTLTKEDVEKQSELLEEAAKITWPSFGITIGWVPVFFSNKKLSPWHGGCAWIFQETKNSPVSALLQLRKVWFDAKKWWTYQRTELLAHELCHVGRMAFNEPVFEEVLAYRTSPSKFRRYWGPIVQSSVEAMMVLLLFFTIVLIDTTLLIYGNLSLYFAFFWLKALPLAVVLWGVFRLIRKQRQFDHCLEKLKQLLLNEHAANAVIYRLTDSEIKMFATYSKDQVYNYLKSNKKESLRHKAIWDGYFHIS